jgi:hypothetical protein
MSTLTPTKGMIAIVENRKLYLEINQIIFEHQNLVHKLDPLQEEACQVIEKLVVAQGIVKEAMQENKEKIKTPITMHTSETILEQ